MRTTLRPGLLCNMYIFQISVMIITLSFGQAYDKQIFLQYQWSNPETLTLNHWVNNSDDCTKYNMFTFIHSTTICIHMIAKGIFISGPMHYSRFLYLKQGSHKSIRWPKAILTVLVYNLTTTKMTYMYYRSLNNYKTLQFTLLVANKSSSMILGAMMVCIITSFASNSVNQIHENTRFENQSIKSLQSSSPIGEGNSTIYARQHRGSTACTFISLLHMLPAPANIFNSFVICFI